MELEDRVCPHRVDDRVRIAVVKLRHRLTNRHGQESVMVCSVHHQIQCYPRFKNLSSGLKSLELCADVEPDVGIKAKSRLLRFL